MHWNARIRELDIKSSSVLIQKIRTNMRESISAMNNHYTDSEQKIRRNQNVNNTESNR